MWSKWDADFGNSWYKGFEVRTPDSKSVDLEISFETKDLRELCYNAEWADESLGKEVAGFLRGRVKDIDAAANIFELPLGDPNLVFSDLKEICVIKLGQRAELHFVANHNENPRSTEDTIDWAKVSRLRLVAVKIIDE